MSATKHSARVLIVVDPIQDYEESDRILGVYKSLAAAKYAAPIRMREAWRSDPNRRVEIQQWIGDAMTAVWEYWPNRGTWRNETLNRVYA